LNFQATWTWSRALSNSGWTNYLGDRTYNLTGQHRSHTLNVFGSYTLPFGPGGLFFRDTSGWLKKSIEGWQIGWITAMRSGSPTSLTGENTQWNNNNWPIIVRPDLWNNKAGKPEVIWNEHGTFAGGRYFGDGIYTRVMDPGVCNRAALAGGGSIIGTPERNFDLYMTQCWNETDRLPRGTTRAIALADPSRAYRDENGIMITLDPLTGAPWALLYDKDTMGADGIMYEKGTPVIVFRNANGGYGTENDILKPGNFKANSLTNPGQFTLDVNLQKAIEFMDGKRFELRIDAANILNHAELTGTTAASTRYLNGGRIINVSAPTGLTLNAAGAAIIGSMPGKVGHRTFQARLALRF
jgi:hypothetical protein